MLQVSNLTIEPLFREVNFCVPRGEIVTLMGPSGSGKSTLFAWMVGALSDDFQAQGELWLDERRCDGLPVEARGLGILFQDALLFDHFSVGQNLLLALPERIVGRARREAVEQALGSAGLAGHYASDPATLSGGERARVSLLPCLQSRRRYCWMNRSAVSIMRYAPRFGHGYLTLPAHAIFRWFWSRMTTKTCPRAAK
jgi:putative thiamine transport system ATP-binding protein